MAVGQFRQGNIKGGFQRFDEYQNFHAGKYCTLPGLSHYGNFLAMQIHMLIEMLAIYLGMKHALRMRVPDFSSFYK